MKWFIDFLNVGFGEATVIRRMEEHCTYCLVVDGGDVNPMTNPRRCSLEQYLREYEIKKIDVLVLTHFHRDHVGGVLPILGHVPIEEVILHLPLPGHVQQSALNDYSTPILGSFTLYAAILNRIDELGIKKTEIKKRHTIVEQDMEFRILTPSQHKWTQLTEELDRLNLDQLDQQKERLTTIDRMLNHASLAVLIKNKGNSVALLTSDVGLDYWEPYADEIGAVHTLQAPHHGDASHLSEDNLRAWTPHAVVISADDQGTYQLPHAAMEPLIHEHSDAQLFYTEGLSTEHRIVRVDVTEGTVELVK
ncbi:MBL fold metallo-hydrolase [Paenibacillus sp. ACRSA]|uniref:ComEC/Rec2 family competence protein n=1 Tax=Paenibacillus sp. ACRSA TaxID=2918211 RepID=UPI001EF49ADD|nr:MBL fold metallo-hydrolase [Paenibacillus sp. ACRSA]MCG7378282.1 MBL fold metallo-hydrolase [Paenibacillus sp. ACRSA]